MGLLNDVVGRLEGLEALDRVAEPLAGAVGRAVADPRIRNLLSGTALGHPAHPLLTDIPIGAWTMSAVLDVLGGRRSQRAADLLVAVGIAAAVPTAATGLNDWSDTYGGERRVGVVHAAANSTALLLYGASLVERCRGRRGRAKALAVGGLGALVAGGSLGGYLSFVKGVNVNHTAFRYGPEEWTDVLAAAELEPGQRRLVQAGDISVLLVREGTRIRALDSVCSHAGGPLEEGEIVDGCVTCPWHGSVFRLEDGSIVRGPASIPQPAYDARVQDGRIQVRARA